MAYLIYTEQITKKQTNRTTEKTHWPSLQTSKWQQYKLAQNLPCKHTAHADAD